MTKMVVSYFTAVVYVIGERMNILNTRIRALHEAMISGVRLIRHEGLVGGTGTSNPTPPTRVPREQIMEIYFSAVILITVIISFNYSVVIDNCPGV